MKSLTKAKVSGDGGWAQLGSPLLVRILATAGFGWVGLDGQHGRFDRLTILETMAMSRPDWAPIMVRVPANDAGEIGFALDSGARGVIIPMVGSVAEAESAVEAALYPPHGRRSWGPLAQVWGAQPPRTAEANNATEVWLMIETVEGLNSVHEIAAVEGVTGIFVGPNDLSLSLGTTVSELLSRTGHESPLVIIRDAVRDAGRTLAVYGGAASPAFTELGYTTRARGSDADFVMSGIGSLGLASAAEFSSYSAR